MMKTWIIATILAVGLAIPSNAQAFSLATWNAAGTTVEGATENRDNLKLFGAALRKANNGTLPDVLVIQEVTSYAAARIVADTIGYTNAEIATSDVGDDTDEWFRTLEIAIITSDAIVSAISYQNQPMKRGKPLPLRPPYVDRDGKLTKDDAELLVVPDPFTARPSRGFLRVELADGTVVYGVHLKSSGLAACRAWQAPRSVYSVEQLARSFGLDTHADAIEAAAEAVAEYGKTISPDGDAATNDETLASAAKREAELAALAVIAKADVDDNRSVYVAGDFNTALNEPCKTGIDLSVDSTPQVGCKRRPHPESCGEVDGFDDSLAILTMALTGGAEFTALTEGIGSSYVKKGFIESPIDNIFVAGPASKTDHTAIKITGKIEKSKVFGSDHYAAMVRR